MKKLLIFIFLGMSVFLAGCTTLSKIANDVAPCTRDCLRDADGVCMIGTEGQGACIPGTHKIEPKYEGPIASVPYGQAAAAAVLIVWNALSIVRGNKYKKGLKGTVEAINQVRNDPTVIADWTKLRDALKANQQASGGRPTVEKVMAEKT